MEIRHIPDDTKYIALSDDSIRYPSGFDGSNYDSQLDFLIVKPFSNQLDLKAYLQIRDTPVKIFAVTPVTVERRVELILSQ